MSLVCVGMKMLHYYEASAPGYYVCVTTEGERPCHASVYRYDPTDPDYKWRSATGCADVGPFDEDDYFVGPIEWSKYV